METKIAIDTLSALKSNLESEVSGKGAQIGALALALEVLGGTLVTQMAALDTAQAEKQVLSDKLIALGEDPVAILVPDVG